MVSVNLKLWVDWWKVIQGEPMGSRTDTKSTGDCTLFKTGFQSVKNIFGQNVKIPFTPVARQQITTGGKKPGVMLGGFQRTGPTTTRTEFFSEENFLRRPHN